MKYLIKISLISISLLSILVLNGCSSKNNIDTYKKMNFKNLFQKERSNFFLDRTYATKSIDFSKKKNLSNLNASSNIDFSNKSTFSDIDFSKRKNLSNLNASSNIDFSKKTIFSNNSNYKNRINFENKDIYNNYNQPKRFNNSLFKDKEIINNDYITENKRQNSVQKIKDGSTLIAKSLWNYPKLLGEILYLPFEELIDGYSERQMKKKLYKEKPHTIQIIE